MVKCEQFLEHSSQGPKARFYALPWDNSLSTYVSEALETPSVIHHLEKLVLDTEISRINGYQLSLIISTLSCPNSTWRKILTRLGLVIWGVNIKN